MIGQHLIAAVRIAGIAARQQPEQLAAALDHVADQVDRLLDLQGERMEPLRLAGQRLARLVHRVQHQAEAPATAIAQMRAEAVVVIELEKITPVNVVPRHYMPQAIVAGARNPLFSVIQGGRA